MSKWQTKGAAKKVAPFARYGLVRQCAKHPAAPNALVLPAGWRPAFCERPRVVRELEHQKPIVHARAPDRSLLGIEVHLRRAIVGTTGNPCGMVCSRARRCRARWIVVGDFSRPDRIADIED